MPLFTGEISLQLKWSKYCFSVAGTEPIQLPELSIPNKKLYVPVVNLSTKNIEKFA